MAETKKTVKPVAKAKAVAKVEEPKKEVKVEAKAVEAAPVKKEAAKKVAPAKKETVKKEVAKKETVKKETAKKAAPAKAAAKKTTVKAVVNVQFAGKAYTTDELVKIAQDVWKYDLGQKAADFKTVELYVKPEESLAYYVINGDVTGSFAI